MQVEHILIAGFTILISVVGFFLTKFYTQVEKTLDTVVEIKIEQTKQASKQDYFEKRLETFERLLIPNLKNDVEKYNTKP